MTIIQFPSNKYIERRKARDIIAALVNTTGCQDEISMRMAMLVEAMDKNNFNLMKVSYDWENSH